MLDRKRRIHYVKFEFQIQDKNEIMHYLHLIEDAIFG